MQKKKHSSYISHMVISSRSKPAFVKSHYTQMVDLLEDYFTREPSVSGN